MSTFTKPGNSSGAGTNDILLEALIITVLGIVIVLIPGCSIISPDDAGNPADPVVTGPPEQPSGLTASDGSYISFIRLNWNSAYGAEGYEIYWAGSSDGVYTAFDTTSSTTFDDYDGGDGSTYYFKIKAYNQYGYSDFSNFDSGWAVDLCNGSWEPAEGYSSITDGLYFTNVFMPASPGYVSYRGWMYRGDTYRITIYGFYYPDNADLFLYSTYGDELERSNSGAGGEDEVIIYTAPDTGHYFIRVVNWLGDSFSFSISFTRL